MTCPSWRGEHCNVRQLAVTNAGSEARQGIPPRSRVPYANPPVMACRYYVPAVVGPGQAIDRGGVRFSRGSDPDLAIAAQETVLEQAKAVFVVQHSDGAPGATDIPYPYRTIDTARGQNMFMLGGPGRGQDSATMAC